MSTEATLSSQSSTPSYLAKLPLWVFDQVETCESSSFALTGSVSLAGRLGAGEATLADLAGFEEDGAVEAVRARLPFFPAVAEDLGRLFWFELQYALTMSSAWLLAATQLRRRPK